MRINNNLMAMNTHRQLGINNTATSKSLEKLSSGFRINRAGDDAAGLAISEKMRGQIRGLNMASKNAQDGISLIQTAEGALTETHAILQRMRELAVQSANDTNVEVDRGEIQKEIDQLAAELTRIADTTEFNTQNLLGGKFNAKFHVGANEGQNVDLSINNMSAKALGVEGAGGLIVEETVNSTGVTNIDDLAVADGGEYQVVKLDEATNIDAVTGATHVLKDADGKIVGASADGKKFTIAAKAGDVENVDLSTGAGTVTFTAPVKDNSKISVAGDNTSVSFTADTVYAEKTELASGTYKIVSGSDRLDTSHTDNVLINVATDEIVAYGDSDSKIFKAADGTELLNSAVALAAGKEYEISSGGGIDVSTQETADKAITTINAAIETVSTERSKLGAMQNRLEHTIKNLDTSAENLQAAESRIRDVDMAKEMMEFTKQNILQQAATAMLAQANQAPQTVLQLLR